MKNIVTILLLILVITSSCKKEKISYSLKGQIVLCYSPTNQVAYKNAKIELFQQKIGIDRKGEIIGTTTTDSSGNFNFTYTTNNITDKIKIRESSGFGLSDIISGIPVKNIDNLKVYYSGRYNLVVILNVINPYTNNDTLFVSNLKTLTYLKRAGPFVNGRVYTEGGVSLLEDPSYNGNKQTMSCGLNSLQNLIFNKEFIVSNNFLCGDTVYVTLDIK